MSFKSALLIFVYIDFEINELKVYTCISSILLFAFWVHVGRSFTYVPNPTKRSHGALCIPDHPVHSCILIEFISQHMRLGG